MTPKEKAKFIFDKYDDYPLTHWWKKQCALIAVDEILKICSPTKIVYSEMVNGCLSEYTEDYFFNQVKQELENL